jgi:hypothetical protein
VFVNVLTAGNVNAIRFNQRARERIGRKFRAAARSEEHHRGQRARQNSFVHAKISALRQTGELSMPVLEIRYCAGNSAGPC